MSVKVKIDWFTLKVLESAKLGGRVQVGWREQTKYDADTPVYKVAQIQEYGARIPVTDKMRKWFAVQGFPLSKHTTEIVIPPRAFMRKTVDNHQKEWVDKFKNDLVKVFDGKMTLEKAMDKLGAIIQGDLKETISTFSEPANSPMTIAMKGFNAPLRNTGVMLDTVDYEVETNDY